MLTVNGMFPGPTIEANWGDTIVVHLTNGLANNGTSIHFHGVRQLNTNQEDGTVAITQCPTAVSWSVLGPHNHTDRFRSLATPSRTSGKRRSTARKYSDQEVLLW